MIIWIASYPKSGNTWLRAILSSYYYSSDGNFDFSLLKKIESFPQKKFFIKYSTEFKSPVGTTYHWIKAQKKINNNKKLNFFKTHNSFCNINGNNFTDRENTLGCIYIIRDPRNIITSLKNHYELNYKEALDFMLNEKKFICDNNVKNDFSDIQFLGSWSKHYDSWLNNKIFPVKLVKYEDLIKNTLKTFEEIVEFVSKINKSNATFDKKKAEESVLSTNFNNLKSKELKGEFTESIYSKKKKKKKIFFKFKKKKKLKKN